MALDREEVIWAYRLLLRREPENEDVITQHRRSSSRAALLANFQKSTEYKILHNTLWKWFITPVFDERLLMWVNIGDHHVSRGCIENNWEPPETDFVMRHLKPGQAFVDIGANVGWFTLLASTLVGSTGKIVSFEPRPDTGDYLSRSIALNHLEKIVTLHRVGLWSEPGELKLLFSNEEMNPGGAHLAPNGGGGVGQKVPMITLDSLRIDRCDLVKMDIEGAEPHAMRGGRDTLRRLRPLILSELHGPQLRRVSDSSVSDYLELMASMGYRARVLGGAEHGKPISIADGGRWDGGMTSVVFVPEERADIVI